MLLLGHDTEGRLSLTFELPVTRRVFPFVGAGAAYNTDGYGHVDSMIGGGIDIALNDRLILGITLRKIFQRRISDRDSEMVVTLGFKL